MKYPATRVFLVILAAASFGAQWDLRAQATQNREIEIHKNVRLIVVPVQAVMPQQLKQKFESFLPVLQEALAETTSAETPECALTVRVTAGSKEIGTAKVQRVFARFVAYRRNSDREFVARLYLHSFITGGPVGQKEITDFLEERILSIAKCQPKTAQGQASPRS